MDYNYKIADTNENAYIFTADYFIKTIVFCNVSLLGKCPDLNKNTAGVYHFITQYLQKKAIGILTRTRFFPCWDSWKLTYVL